MFNLSSLVFRLVFLSLVAVAPLFPPVEWRVATTRGRPASNNEEVQERTRYVFLFGSSERDFFGGWGWDYNAERSIPLLYRFDRRVDSAELAIEWALAFALASLADVMWSFGKRRSTPPGAQGAAAHPTAQGRS
jgi:hypothetical protein